MLLRNTLLLLIIFITGDWSHTPSKDLSISTILQNNRGTRDGEIKKSLQIDQYSDPFYKAEQIAHNNQDGKSWNRDLLLIIMTLAIVVLITTIVVAIYYPSPECLWFLVYVFFGFNYVLTFSNTGDFYIFSPFPSMEENHSIFLASVCISAFFEFSRQVLRMKAEYPILNKVIICFDLLYPLVAFLGFGINFSLINQTDFRTILSLIYILKILCFIIISCLSVNESVFRGRNELWWFVVILAMLVFVATITILRSTFIFDTHSIQVVLLAIAVIPQMILTLIFLIRECVVMLKTRTRQITELQLVGEQSVLRERLRISRELHDEMGATLSGIAMYTHLTKDQIKLHNIEAAKNSLTIMETATTEMITKLSDIVWLVNPTQDSLDKLIARLEEYSTNMARIKSMEVQVSVPETLMTLELSVEMRRNIYLFCKEAINNAVKHSHGSWLKLIVTQSEKSVMFCISDNGHGLDFDLIKKGNGMDNMNHRSTEMNGTLHFEARKGQGTKVCLEFPLV